MCFGAHVFAFRYLHEVCSPSVVHKNFKSANILLDMELNPHLSDCGLASLVLDADQVCTKTLFSSSMSPMVCLGEGMKKWKVCTSSSLGIGSCLSVMLFS